MSNLRLLPKHTQTVSISDLNMLQLPPQPLAQQSFPPQTAKPRTPGQFALCIDRLSGVSKAGDVFYFRKSDQIKIIPIKKHHWASRTASAHLTQNRPTAKCSLS